MNNPTIEKIKAMPQEELEALNRKTTQKLATRVVGLVFLKLAVPRVLGLIAAKALITAAKKI
jgi:hypothetical protein